VQVDVHRVDAEVARADLAPQVLGLVIITAATSGPSRALSAARSTRPAAFAGIASTR
jgi:hypothetical protein